VNAKLLVTEGKKMVLVSQARHVGRQADAGLSCTGFTLQSVGIAGNTGSGVE